MKLVFCVHSWYSNLGDFRVQYSCARINVNIGYFNITIKGCFVLQRDYYLRSPWQLWRPLFEGLVMKSANLFSVKIWWTLIPPLRMYELKYCNLMPIFLCVCHNFTLFKYFNCLDFPWITCNKPQKWNFWISIFKTLFTLEIKVLVLPCKEHLATLYIFVFWWIVNIIFWLRLP